MATIASLPAKASQDDVLKVLERDGCVIVRDVLEVSVRRAVEAELKPYLDVAGLGLSPEYHFTTTQRDDGTMEARLTDDPDAPEFFPGNTKRLLGVIAKSPTCGTLAVHPLMLGVCDRTLKPNCVSYQLNASVALVVGPGAGAQVLHREDVVFAPVFHCLPNPRPNMITVGMWAISDFTEENGATHLVPGSHRWPEERVARDEEVAVGAMPAGSLLMWTGRTLHAVGRNRSSNSFRFGAFFSYSLGWLRQEENQYLTAPLEVARTFPEELQRLLGYQMHEGLGYVELFGQPPLSLLKRPDHPAKERSDRVIHKPT